MRYLLNFATYSGAALIVLTTVSAALAVWRRRDAHRVDILLFVTALALPRYLPDPGALGSIKLAAFLAQPYLLLRLLRHFRNVPGLVISAAVVLPALSIAVYSASPAIRATLGKAPLFIAVTAIFGYAAIAFTREARRSAGLTARRVLFAAVGTWCSVIGYCAVIPSWSGDASTIAGRLEILLTSAALGGYFLAFGTPRWLLTSWRGTVQAKYLNATARYDAEERGARTAEDLRRAAASSANNALTLVALRDPRQAGSELVVRTASDARLIGIEIPPGSGLISSTIATAQARGGAATDCGPALSGTLSAAGARALVAPIASDAHAWGIVVAVQRRGSLFPDDDLQLLSELARYAAMSLDHAHLVQQQRARERKAADRRLREVESRMGLMLEAITDYAMLVLDHRGRIVNWPPGAEHVFGASALEMQDEPAAPLFGLTDEECLMLLADAKQRGRAERDGPCRRRDGTRFVGSIVIRPLASDVDQLDGFVAVVRDVTERRHLEDRVRQTQKMEAIGQLAGGIAHDFNNLLTAILGYSDWLAKDIGGDDPRRLPVAEIQKAGERAAGLTRQLLTFSRRQVVQPTPQNLSRLTSELVPMLRRVMGEHVEIGGDLDPDVAPIFADRGQVEQILINLAVNARDAMPKGGRLLIRTANVRLDERAVGPDAAAGPYVLLEVTDTGVGMDAATQERAFEPFFTTKELGRGAGLGLATVYGIVRQMDGFVTLASQPTQGSTFRLYFPDACSRISASPASTAAARRDTLLLIEDDEAVRVFLTQLLEREGYHVLAAETPQAAIALARAHTGTIHLVITAGLLPAVTGAEVARAIGEGRSDVPVLHLAADADDVPAGPATVTSASDVLNRLNKPFASDDLLTRIAQILIPQA
jgi:PAS domain S-box-containing protein